jgi:ribosomal protein L40E
MSQETLGYVNLEWVCPKCESRVPGPDKTCPNCGAPQPKNVAFVQALGEVSIQNNEMEQVVAKGADIHCPFCDTRNPADAVVCSQCGAELKEGIRRESGQVIGAYTISPLKSITCPNCGADNPINAKSCSACGSALHQPAQPQPVLSIPLPQAAQRSKYFSLGIIIGLAILCLIGIFAVSKLTAPQDAQSAQVASVGWQTAVQILGLVPVTRSDWQAEIPVGNPISYCTDRVYKISNIEPFGEDYRKVCGTPYTIDTGTGIGRVVQDCQYEILQPYCEFKTEEWRVIDTVYMQGKDLDPIFAEPRLTSAQQMGSTSSEYSVVFETEEGQQTYRTTDLNEFRQFSVGSEWLMQMNALGQIVSIERAD